MGFLCLKCNIVDVHSKAKPYVCIMCHNYWVIILIYNGYLFRYISLALKSSGSAFSCYFHCLRKTSRRPIFAPSTLYSSLGKSFFLQCAFAFLWLPVCDRMNRTFSFCVVPVCEGNSSVWSKPKPNKSNTEYGIIRPKNAIYMGGCLC